LKLDHINTYGFLPRFYIDRPFQCRDCGKEEIWRAADQKWYYEEAKGHTDATALGRDGSDNLSANAIYNSTAGASAGLTAGTLYHYRLVGINSAGTMLGSDMIFTTTGPGAPTVTTLGASDVTATNATLNGTVNTGGLSTKAYFEYGLTTNYGSFGATNTLASTNTTLSVSNLLGGLSIYVFICLPALVGAFLGYLFRRFDGEQNWRQRHSRQPQEPPPMRPRDPQR
jgi:hypothetical protein